jgi:TRAP-type C4-dicarboxylate transport system permease small subunit
VVTEAAGMLLFLSLIRSSLVLVPNAQLQTSAGLGLPLGWVYAAVPAGAALILLPMAARLAAALRELWPRPS